MVLRLKGLLWLLSRELTAKGEREEAGSLLERGFRNLGW